MFTQSSRYYNLETASLATAEGAVIRYKCRRFLPQGEKMPLLVELTVTEGDRLDLMAVRTLGDPEQFWRICDANDAMDPSSLLVKLGRKLRVPMPQLDGLTG